MGDLLRLIKALVREGSAPEGIDGFVVDRGAVEAPGNPVAVEYPAV